MKKLLTLALALVLALSIAAPALAFTSNVPDNDDDVPFELDVYLVEYEDNDFFGITTLPPADRGYAKNEIVAAVAELYVPKNQDPAGADYGYTEIEFSGENVNFNVTDNTKPLITSNVDAAKIPGTDYTITSDEVSVKLDAGDLSSTSNKTYRWLVFAKVTDDDASITFGLRTTPAAFNAGVLDMGDYTVTKTTVAAGGFTYTVSTNTADLFIITVDKNYKSTGLQIVDGGTGYTVVALANGGLGFISGGSLVDKSSNLYEDLMDIFEEEFEDEFGLDFDLLGNVVNDDFFFDYIGSDDVEATVDIKPYTAVITVPDDVVVNPPKTGDTASILGFVMLVLAAAAVVAVKKVRA